MVSLLTSIGWDRRPLLFFLPEEHRPQSWLLPLPLAILQPVCLLPTALYPSFSHSPSAPNLESPSWPTSTKVLTFCKPKQPEPKASLKRILSPLVFASGYRKGEVCWGALRRGVGVGGRLWGSPWACNSMQTQSEGTTEGWRSQEPGWWAQRP